MSLIVIEESKWDELTALVGSLVKEVRAMVASNAREDMLSYKEAAALARHWLDMGPTGLRPQKMACTSSARAFNPPLIKMTPDLEPADNTGSLFDLFQMRHLLFYFHDDNQEQ